MRAPNNTQPLSAESKHIMSERRCIATLNRFGYPLDDFCRSSDFHADADPDCSSSEWHRERCRHHDYIPEPAASEPEPTSKNGALHGSAFDCGCDHPCDGNHPNPPPAASEPEWCPACGGDGRRPDCGWIGHRAFTEAAPAEGLLPCPFCGIVPNGPIDFGEDDGAWFIRCVECNVDGPLEATPADAITAWNTRTPAPESRDGGAETAYEGVPTDPVDGCPQRTYPHDHILCNASAPQKFSDLQRRLSVAVEALQDVENEITPAGTFDCTKAVKTIRRIVADALSAIAKETT